MNVGRSPRCQPHLGFSIDDRAAVIFDMITLPRFREREYSRVKSGRLWLSGIHAARLAPPLKTTKRRL